MAEIGGSPNTGPKMGTDPKGAAKRGYLPPDEVSMFCEQVALILKSGIPMYDGIEALCQNYHDTRYAGTFLIIDAAVKETGSLAEALERAGIFPPYMVHMVRIGEKSGKLDDVMAALGVYYLRESKVRLAVRGAIVYPAVLAVMMAVVIGVLVAQVLPIFDRVFRNLGTEMSASMTTVMNVGLVVGRAVLVLVALALAALLAGVVLSKTGRQKQINAFVRRAFPPIRRGMEK
ncbi:MAG: type II secretion system F family protein, partial [Firmicutes bacterium]|nr:type II secretion system F family protein [Bacillota bacterium]